jgi:3-dehydroquinate dehydratase-2
MKIALVNGPNLNLLGSREPQIYGTQTFENYLDSLRLKHPTVDFEYFQSNVEGELINFLQKCNATGIILNGGGYSHTSVALRDCISSISIPVVEVHISNIAGRESFRHESLLSPVCAGCVFGFGLKGYELALNYFLSEK